MSSVDLFSQLGRIQAEKSVKQSAKTETESQLNQQKSIFNELNNQSKTSGTSSSSSEIDITSGADTAMPDNSAQLSSLQATINALKAKFQALTSDVTRLEQDETTTRQKAEEAKKTEDANKAEEEKKAAEAERQKAQKEAAEEEQKAQEEAKAEGKMTYGEDQKTRDQVLKAEKSGVSEEDIALLDENRDKSITDSELQNAYYDNIIDAQDAELIDVDNEGNIIPAEDEETESGESADAKQADKTGETKPAGRPDGKTSAAKPGEKPDEKAGDYDKDEKGNKVSADKPHEKYQDDRLAKLEKQNEKLTRELEEIKKANKAGAGKGAEGSGDAPGKAGNGNGGNNGGGTVQGGSSSGSSGGGLFGFLGNLLQLPFKLLGGIVNGVGSLFGGGSSSGGTTTASSSAPARASSGSSSASNNNSGSSSSLSGLFSSDDSSSSSKTSSTYLGRWFDSAAETCTLGYVDYNGDGNTGLFQSLGATTTDTVKLIPGSLWEFGKGVYDRI